MHTDYSTDRRLGAPAIVLGVPQTPLLPSSGSEMFTKEDAPARPVFSTGGGVPGAIILSKTFNMQKETKDAMG